MCRKPSAPFTPPPSVRDNARHQFSLPFSLCVCTAVSAPENGAVLASRGGLGHLRRVRLEAPLACASTAFGG